MCALLLKVPSAVIHWHIVSNRLSASLQSSFQDIQCIDFHRTLTFDRHFSSKSELNQSQPLFLFIESIRYIELAKKNAPLRTSSTIKGNPDFYTFFECFTSFNPFCSPIRHSEKSPFNCFSTDSRILNWCTNRGTVSDNYWNHLQSISLLKTLIYARNASTFIANINNTITEYW